MKNAFSPLRIGTRGSALALAQTELVVGALKRLHPTLPVSVVTIQTQGDRDKTSPLTEIGGRGVFTSALGDALRRGEIDAAVHSAKDLPSRQPPDLQLVAFLARSDPRDVFISRHGVPLSDLKPNPVIGTSSRRRMAQVRRLRTDVRLVDLRGNVDTRLRKAFETDLDGIVLAAAGVARLGLDRQITEYLSVESFVPAPGQGALAIEIRAGDEYWASLLADLDDPLVSGAVRVERVFLAGIGGGCTTPVGAHARVIGEQIHLIAMVASDDGERIESIDELIDGQDAETRATEIATRLVDVVAPPIAQLPLTGYRVLVTRATEDAGSLIDALKRAGAEPIAMPTIQIADVDDPAPLNEAINRVVGGGYDWIVVTSQHAVCRVLNRLSASGLGRAAVAAVGSSTAARLRAGGVDVHLIPEQSTAQRLIDSLIKEGVVGKRVLFLRGTLAKETVRMGLESAGAIVDEVNVYQTERRASADPHLLSAIDKGEVDAVTLLSPSSVDGIVSLVGDNVSVLSRMAIVCIGPVTAGAARAAGLRVDAIAAEATVEGIVAALVDLRRRGEGKT